MKITPPLILYIFFPLLHPLCCRSRWDFKETSFSFLLTSLSKPSVLLCTQKHQGNRKDSHAMCIISGSHEANGDFNLWKNHSKAKHIICFIHRVINGFIDAHHFSWSEKWGWHDLLLMQEKSLSLRKAINCNYVQKWENIILTFYIKVSKHSQRLINVNVIRAINLLWIFHQKLQSYCFLFCCLFFLYIILVM